MGRLGKSVRLCFGLLILWMFCSVVSIWGATDQFHLTILHTNDYHGADYAALGKMATLLKEIRAKEPNVLYLDGGDLFNHGVYCQVFYGELEFAALNAMGCNGLVLGNNEFVADPDLKTAQQCLFDRINQAKFPVLGANVRTAKEGAYLPKVQPYAVVEMNGVKVGILGLTTMGTGFFQQTKGFSFEDPREAAVKIFPEVKGKADLVVALTHIGFEEDKVLAKKLPELAAIVGGHSHTELQKPFMQNTVPIVQAGDEGRFLGRLDLFFQWEDGKLVLKEYVGKLIPIDESIKEDPEMKKLVEGFMERI